MKILTHFSMDVSIAMSNASTGRQHHALSAVLSAVLSAIRKRRAYRHLSVLVSGVGVSLLSGMAGCGGDNTATAPLDVAQTYWTLRLNEHAVTLALTPPYDTIRLRAVPRTPQGDSLAALGAVQYTLNDTSISVDASGLVRAKSSTVARGKPAYIIASMQDTVHRVTHADTVFIQVTPTAPAAPLTTFSIQLNLSDSAKRALDGQTSVTLAPKLQDANGTTMNTNILVAFTSSDLTLATITSRTVSTITNRGGKLGGVRPGHVTFHAATWAYGVSKRDSLPFTFTDANNVLVSVLAETPYGSLTPILYFFPNAITISVGGVVTWDNQNAMIPVSVVFDDPTHVDSAAGLNTPSFYPYSGQGNIGSFMYDTSATAPAPQLIYVRKARSFPVAGTYHYHSPEYGTTGVVNVR